MSSYRLHACLTVHERSSASPRLQEWKVPSSRRKICSYSSDPVMTRIIEFVEDSGQPASVQCLRSGCKLTAFDFRRMFSRLSHGREADAKHVVANSVAHYVRGNNGF